MNRAHLFEALGDLPDRYILEFAAEPARRRGPALRKHWGVLAAGLAAVLALLLIPAQRMESGGAVSPPPAAAVTPGESANPGGLPWEELPVLRYGTPAAAASDYSIAVPEGSSSRPLTQEDISALLGGEEVPASLGWDGYTLEGTVIFQADGSLWMLDLYGNKGPLDHFNLALAQGQLPPTCTVYAESVCNELWGVEVMADKYDGSFGLSRRITFLRDDVGCRFDITGEAGTAAAVEELVSRFVRLALRDGLDLSAISNEGAVPFHTPQPDFSVGDPNREAGA